MDRRQARTRRAILTAFRSLLLEQDYAKITVQQIIERADIGRSTFYDHFETRDALLETLCDNLFEHVFEASRKGGHRHGSFLSREDLASSLCHLLYHLAEDDGGTLELMTNDSSGLFMRRFREGVEGIVRAHRSDWQPMASLVPEEFVVNHVSAGFVEAARWWISSGKPESPEALVSSFCALTPLVGTL